MTNEEIISQIQHYKNCIRIYENSETLSKYKDWNKSEGFGAIQILIKLENWIKNNDS